MKYRSDFKIGLEFEFKTELDKNKISKQLSNILKKEIKVADTYHSNIEVTENSFKLEPDFSGGKQLVELITGPLPYNEAKKIIKDVCSFIDKKGYTDEKCSIHVNLSIMERNKYSNLSKKLNPLNLILNVDEDKIYDLYPDRKNSIYAKSVKEIYPKSIWIKEYSFNFIDGMIQIPNTKYYGINFLKLPQNYLEFRYLGGKDWHKNTKNIQESIDSFIDSIWKSVTKPELTLENKKQISNIINKYVKIRNVCLDSSKFRINYPDIEITVDLEKNEQRHFIREKDIGIKLFKLIIDTDIKKGKVNWDSERTRLQLKETEILKSHDLREFDFVNSKLSGNFTNCTIHNCDITEATLENCYIKGCTIEKSKIKKSFVDSSTTAYNTYVDNRKTEFNGELQTGIFRTGVITDDTKFGKEAEIISFDMKEKKKDDTKLVYKGRWYYL